MTIVLDFEQPASNIPLRAVHTELQKLLRPSSLSVDLRLRSELPAEPQFGQVLLFKMKGACTLKGDLPVAALSDERGPLAMTYTTDGQMLPFGEVECDRVRQSLMRLWGPESESAHSHEFAVALARVLAHEIYHMLGQSSAHTKSGVTKQSLSAWELTAPNLPLPRDAQDVITPRPGQ